MRFVGKCHYSNDYLVVIEVMSCYIAELTVPLVVQNHVVNY